MAQPAFSRLARDTAYVAVGFGLLGFQRAQVARRSLEKHLARSLPPEVSQLAAAAGDLLGDLRRDLPKDANALARELAAFGRFALQVLRSPASRPNYP
jgi:hypothetical protein